MSEAKIETLPTLVITSDYDGYFGRMVAEWIGRKSTSGAQFKHHTIEITSGPYRNDAVTYVSRNRRLVLDFYSALRTGFGSLSDQDILDIIELL